MYIVIKYLKIIFMKNFTLLLVFLFCINLSAQNITSTISYQGYDESQAYFGQGEYEIFVDNVDGILDKPIILVDGFDPGDTRDLSMLYNSLDIGGQNLADILRDEGYDFVALNAPLYTTDGKDIDGGADYIQRNAMVLIELINFINSEKVGSEELVIIGPSMGGLISRYGLAYMEENNMPHETRLYISFDSPHLGANIPIGFQYLINYFAKQLDNDQAQLVVDNVLNSPAAKEMLVDHYTGHLLPGSDFEQDSNILLPVGAPNFRDVFQTELNDLGFPATVRNVSMVNGSGQGTTTGEPGMDMINTTLDLGATITADIKISFTPAAGESINVTSFSTFLAGIPVASFGADAESFSFSDGVDSSPGGKSDIASGLGEVDDPIIIEFFENLEQSEYSFIPSVSAMAIENENDWYASPNLDNSPFVNAHIPDANEFHVQLTEQNVAFALSEIREVPLSTEETAYTNFYLMENPVNDKLIVKLGSNNNYSNLEVSVYNTSGQLVLVENIIYPSEVLTLNHNLNSGLYILIINNNNHYFQTKFIVK
ncbi:MAG: T9SS type A sorting domain-containing protein [Flavobacteriales bacterium]|nr:MAG: T9SS type A sorting domain-containing protein [Flavobacteriales bacterium]